jgi:hypothetical protein
MDIDMQAAVDRFLELTGGYLPGLVGGLAILIIGWLAAVVVSSVVRRMVQRIPLISRAMVWASSEEVAKREIGRWVGRLVFWTIITFVLIAFFQALSLTVVTESLNKGLGQVSEFAPRIIAAGLLLVLAWAIATALRIFIMRVVAASRLEERFGTQSGVTDLQQVPFGRTVGNVAFWLVLLLFVPALLDALSLEGLLTPIQVMLTKALGFLPNLLGAVLILIVGWFLARILQRILTGLSAAAGIDRLSEQVGLVTVLGSQRLSNLIGSVAYFLILIPVLIATLEALALDAITMPASSMLQSIMGSLPAIFAAGLVLGIAYAVGRLVSRVTTNVLTGAGFDTLLVRMGLGATGAKAGQRTPSEIVGYLILLAILFGASMEAARLLGFVLLAELVAQFIGFAGKVLLGLVVLAVGLFIANLVGNVVRSTRVAQADLLSVLARVAIWTLAGSMALGAIGIANEIIILAFGITLAAVAVPIAIAFGIGGRELAGRQLDEWVTKIRSRDKADF